MAESENECVCSVEKENKSGFYRIHTIWNDDVIKVNVAANDAAWSGQITKEKISEFSRHLELSDDAYREECKTALTTSGGKPGLVYSVENGAFVWKKVIDEDTGIKVRMGPVPLEPKNFVETIQKMMTVSLNANKSLTERLDQCEKQKAQAELNIETLMEKLNDFIKQKGQMEEDLMSQFLAVLNAKKNKISLLEQELIILKSRKGEVKPKKRKTKTKIEEDVSDPYGQDTDEDVEMTEAGSSRDEPVPSTSSYIPDAGGMESSENDVRNKQGDCLISVDDDNPFCSLMNRTSANGKSIQMETEQVPVLKETNPQCSSPTLVNCGKSVPCNRSEEADSVNTCLSPSYLLPNEVNVTPIEVGLSDETVLYEGNPCLSPSFVQSNIPGVEENNIGPVMENRVSEGDSCMSPSLIEPVNSVPPHEESPSKPRGTLAEVCSKSERKAKGVLDFFFAFDEP